MNKQVIKNVVSDGTSAPTAVKEEPHVQAKPSIESQPATNHELSVLDDLQKSLSMKPAGTAPLSEGPRSRRTNSIYVKHFGNAVGTRQVFNHYETVNKPSQLWKKQGSVSMDAAQIAELFRLRPELSEYCLMEIQNAQLSDIGK